MPTKNRRINVTLTPELEEVVEGLAVALGTPRSKVILSFMEDALPALEMTLAAVREAQSGKEGMALKMVESMLADAGVLVERGQADLFQEKKKASKRARTRK